MAIPDKRADLVALGYAFTGSGRCTGCKKEIEWWQTPKGKKMPMSVQHDGTLLPHWTDCPNASDFRRR